MGQITFNDPKVMRTGIGSDAYREILADFADVSTRELATGEIDYIKAVSDAAGEDAAMAGAEPFAYYGTERSTATGWKNQMTRLSVRELLITRNRSRLRQPDTDAHHSWAH